MSDDPLTHKAMAAFRNELSIHDGLRAVMRIAVEEAPAARLLTFLDAVDAPASAQLVTDEAGDCSVAINYGDEGADGPSGQAQGYGETVVEALEQALAELKL